MHKRHYVAIAAIFKRKLSDPYPQSDTRTAVLRDVADELAAVLKQENSLFDTDKFMSACGFK